MSTALAYASPTAQIAVFEQGCSVFVVIQTLTGIGDQGPRRGCIRVGQTSLLLCSRTVTGFHAGCRDRKVTAHLPRCFKSENGYGNIMGLCRKTPLQATQNTPPPLLSTRPKS